MNSITPTLEKPKTKEKEQTHPEPQKSLKIKVRKGFRKFIDFLVSEEF